MEKLNIIIVYGKDERKILMCERAKDPYKGKLNFVGGKVEAGENELDAAYRELYEETGISKDQIRLTHIMNFHYMLPDVELEVYAGKLTADVELREEINRLFWIDRGEDFCDADRFAGNKNIEHMLLETEEYRAWVFHPDFRICPAKREEAECLADIHCRAWIYAYSGLVPRKDIEEWNEKRRAQWKKNIPVENNRTHYCLKETGNGPVIGFFVINVSGDEDLKDSAYEIVSLYLDPDFVRQGFGTLAMDWIKKEVSRRGYKTISLWVLEENVGARKYYEKCGFIPDGVRKSSGLGDTEEVRYLLRF